MNRQSASQWLATTCLAFAVAASAASAADADKAPEGMALIPAGSFEMGDTFNETGSNALPVHAVTVGAFYIEKYEVTKDLWDSVYHWATNNGYLFHDAGFAKGTNHPVLGVRWYSAVKWCNARSEKEGLTPCYYKSSEQTTATVYRAHSLDLSNSWVNWSANGYRLPTEAEWEKAARGGKPGHRFSWSDSDTISHSNANYRAVKGIGQDVNAYPDWRAGQQKNHPAYEVDKPPHTSPVGSFAPNGYGLYDMTGNAWEHCWDVYDVNWYRSAGATQADTRGPDQGWQPPAPARVVRGGAWLGIPDQQEVARRLPLMPFFGKDYLTFRCVRGQ